jgi:type IV pilus biogenesis protein CpaD/CtpE
MKSASRLAAAVVVAALAALGTGCASEETRAPDAAKPRQRVDAITGSHIPNKTALRPQSDLEREKTVERMRELQKTSQPVQTKPY